jgi:hypothetical protein
VDGDMQYPFNVNEAVLWLGKPESCMMLSVPFDHFICKIAIFQALVCKVLSHSYIRNDINHIWLVTYCLFLYSFVVYLTMLSIAQIIGIE